MLKFILCCNIELLFIEQKFSTTFHPSTARHHMKFQNQHFISLLSVHSARNSYKKCIHNSAMAKCNPRSAKFARDIVDLLSNERHLKNCAEIERTSLCNGGSYLYHDFFITLSSLVTITLISSSVVRKLAALL
jgi:hypothetical protein